MSWLYPGDALRRVLVLCAVGAALAVASCTTTTLYDTDDVAPRRVFAVGLENLNDRYIEPVRLSDVALEGLNNLATIDSAIHVEEAQGSLRLLSKKLTVAEWPVSERADPYEWAALMGDVLDAARAHSAAIRGKSAEQLYDTVFKGLLSHVDHYTHYDGRDVARRNRASRDGFGGIGVTIRVEGQATTITDVTADTPASRAGIKVNDRIVTVNRRSIVGATQEEVVDALRGPIESAITLGIARGDQPPFDVSLARAFIVPTTVTVKRDGDVLDIRLSGFNSATSRQLKHEITRMNRAEVKPLKGIVLDLRGNPGGLLDQAVTVADLFLKDGRIVSTKGRHPDSNQIFDAHSDEWLVGLPMVVIVNGRSASAAEIVAASLRDRGRAVVLGSSSFGKGTVQTIINLPNGGEMVMTWARIISPSGRALQDLGVVPTICTNSDSELVGGLVRALKGDGETARTSLAGYLRGRSAADSPIELRRAACPPSAEENPADMELARLIAGSQRLYQRALVAENPVIAVNEPARP